MKRCFENRAYTRFTVALGMLAFVAFATQAQASTLSTMTNSLRSSHKLETTLASRVKAAGWASHSLESWPHTCMDK